MIHYERSITNYRCVTVAKPKLWENYSGWNIYFTKTIELIPLDRYEGVSGGIIDGFEMQFQRNKPRKVINRIITIKLFVHLDPLIRSMIFKGV